MNKFKIDWSHAPHWATRLMKRNGPSDVPDSWSNDDGSRALWVGDSDLKEFELFQELWTEVARRDEV